MANVFLDCQEIIKYLEKDEVITSSHYVSLLDHLKNYLQKKARDWLNKFFIYTTIYYLIPLQLW